MCENRNYKILWRGRRPMTMNERRKKTLEPGGDYLQRQFVQQTMNQGGSRIPSTPRGNGSRGGKGYFEPSTRCVLEWRLGDTTGCGFQCVPPRRLAETLVKTGQSIYPHVGEYYFSLTWISTVWMCTASSWITCKRFMCTHSSTRIFTFDVKNGRDRSPRFELFCVQLNELTAPAIALLLVWLLFGSSGSSCW